MTFSDHVEYPLQFPTHLPSYVYLDSLRSYRPLKLLLSCQIVEKVVLGPRFVGGGYIPDFGHTFSNRTDFRTCDWFWLSSVQRYRKVADENKDRRR